MTALIAAPLGLLAVSALATMLASTTRVTTRSLMVAGAVAAAAVGLLSIIGLESRLELFGGALIIDAYSGVVTAIVALCGAAALLLSLDSHSTANSYRGEYVTLVLFAVLGASLMSATEDFVTFFLALQLSSLPLYVLTGFNVRNRLATEASIKFLLLGMLASVLMIYGFSVGFVHSPSSAFAAMGGGGGPIGMATTVALVFVLAGFAFKIGAAPLHFWIPDTYQGASSPVTALLSTVPKLGAIAALARFSSVALAQPGHEWTLHVFAGLAVASMVLGNLVALAQTDVKRMLAYSSIAHSGYLLVALATGTGSQMISVTLFYAVVYALTNVGAFAVVGLAAQGRHLVPLEALNGLWKRAPVEAAALVVLVISMLGLPPTPGFWAKLGIVLLAVESGQLWLAVVVVVTSAVSVVFYMRIIKAVFVTAPDEELLQIGGATRVVTAVTMTAVAVVAFWPTGLADLVTLAAAAGTGVVGR